jgi:hypothetical protein
MNKTKSKRGKYAATLSVDLDKKCPRCGKAGPVNGGPCLKCLSGEGNRQARQENLPGTETPLDAVGRAADRFRRVMLDLDELGEQKKDCEKELIEAMKAAGRRSLRLGTVTMTLTHKDAMDRISVKKGT